MRNDEESVVLLLSLRRRRVVNICSITVVNSRVALGICVGEREFVYACANAIFFSRFLGDRFSFRPFSEILEV